MVGTLPILSGSKCPLLLSLSYNLSYHHKLCGAMKLRRTDLFQYVRMLFVHLRIQCASRLLGLSLGLFINVASFSSATIYKRLLEKLISRSWFLEEYSVKGLRRGLLNCFSMRHLPITTIQSYLPLIYRDG